MSSSMLLGFGYRKCSGKNTCADFMRDTHNFKVFAFADPIKIALVSLFGFSHDQVYGESKDIVDVRWGFTPRHAMKQFNDFMRMAFGEDIWVNMMDNRLMEAYSKYPDARIAIADVRHPPEISLIRRWQGVCVHVHRPSLGPPDDTHTSETSLNPSYFDYIVINNNSVQDLYDQLLMLPPIKHLNNRTTA